MTNLGDADRRHSPGSVNGRCACLPARPCRCREGARARCPRSPAARACGRRDRRSGAILAMLRSLHRRGAARVCRPSPLPGQRPAVRSDLPVLMTEKDAVKCTAFVGERHYSVPVRADLPKLLDRIAGPLPVRTPLQDAPGRDALIFAATGRRASRHALSQRGALLHMSASLGRSCKASTS